MLRALVPDAHYHLGQAFERVEPDGDGVSVRFADGHAERADLLVGADGFRSSVRAQVAPDVQPIYAGYVVWRGAPVEASLSPETRRTIFPYFAFYLPPRQQVIGYPIAGLNNEMRPGPPPLQLHLVSRRRRAPAPGDVHRRRGASPRVLDPAPADPRGGRRRHAWRRRGRDGAAVPRRPAADRAPVLHADLRPRLASDGLRPRRPDRRRRLRRPAPHGVRRLQGGGGRPGAGGVARGLRARTSTRGWPGSTPRGSRSASA